MAGERAAQPFPASLARAKDFALCATSARSSLSDFDSAPAEAVRVALPRGRCRRPADEVAHLRNERLRRLSDARRLRVAMRRDCSLLPRKHERLEQHPRLLVTAWGVLRSQRSRAQLVQVELQQCGDVVAHGWRSRRQRCCRRDVAPGVLFGVCSGSVLAPWPVVAQGRVCRACQKRR